MEREQGEPLADVLLVARVDVLLLADVDRYGHAGVRQGKRARLGLAHGCETAVRGLRLRQVVRSELDEVEGEIAATPVFAPVLDQRLLQRRIKLAGSDIGLALIPDRAAQAVGNEGSDHPIEKHRGVVLVLHRVGMLRRATFLAGGHPFRHRMPVVFERFRVVAIVDEFLPEGIAQRLEGRIARELFTADPRFRRARTIGASDEADRHAEFLLELSPEEVGDRGEIARALRRASLPFAFDLALRVLVHRPLGLELPELRVLCLGDFLLPVGRSCEVTFLGFGDREVHVRLARAEPHFTDQHVFKLAGRSGIHLQHMRSAGRQGGEIETELAVGSGGAGDAFAGDAGRYRCSGRGGAPDGIRRVALEHHVAGENPRQPKVGREQVFAEIGLPQRGGEDGGVDFGTFGVRMRMVARCKDGIGSFLTERLVAVGEQVVEVDEAGSSLLRRLLGPKTVVVRAAADLAVLPDVPRDQRNDDRRRTLRFRVGDELPQIPAVAVDGLRLAIGLADDFFLLLADALDRGPAAVVIERAAVVVAELHHHVIARLEVCSHRVPAAFGQESPAAAAADRTIDDFDLRGIEVRDQRISPTAGAGRLIADGRVAEDEKSRFRPSRREQQASDGKADWVSHAGQHGLDPRSCRVPPMG